MADDARAIENLIYSYADRIDAGDLTGVGELFRDGRIAAAPGSVFEGAEAVRKLYERSTRLYDDGTPRTRHIITNVAIEVDGGAGTASARSSYLVLQQTDELPLQPVIVGRYRDTFRHVAGQWCFDTREMLVDLTGDLSHHLLFAL